MFSFYSPKFEVLKQLVSRSGYLVPLVVIMLCLVAFTGAAYAYSTSVKGNGDIAGNYVAIDMYKVDSESQTGYSAVADFVVQIGSFTVTTERNDTVDEKDSFTAKVVATTLVFQTYLHINTNITSGTTFYLTDIDYTFVSPVEGKDKTNLGLGDLKVESVYCDGTKVEPTGNDYVLDPSKYYLITFSIPVSSDTSPAIFGTYSSLTDLGTDIAAFKAATNEIQVTFTASTDPSTSSSTETVEDTNNADNIVSP